MKTTKPLAVDKTFILDITGSRQTVRLCAARTDLPPLLIVQQRPGPAAAERSHKVSAASESGARLSRRVLGATRMRQRF
jgi:hypothetical protein